MDEQSLIKYMITKRYKEGEYVCWDFVRDIYKDLYNIDLPEYPADEIQAEFKYELTSNIKHKKIPIGEAQEGDIIVFSLFANQHAGVMINNESFIHLPKTGVQVSDIADVGKNYVIYRMEK